MKSFRPVAFDAAQCRKELDRLRTLLARRQTLSERGHLLPLFRRCLHLSAFLGSYCADIRHYNLVAFEFDLFGDFLCDLVVGDSVKKAYNFVEFEGAGPRSLFRRRGRKHNREWSPEFDRGYSQIIDWFAKLRDAEKSDAFAARFGARSIECTATLVIGRDCHLGPGERERLEWRRRHVVVDSRKIQCVTFDELLTDLTYRLDTYELVRGR